MVSAAAVGATGLFSPLSGIAPKLVRALYDACRKDQLVEARAAQEAIGALRQLVKPGGVASLKAALRAIDRDCGVPRPPLRPLDAENAQQLCAALDAIPALRDEPRRW